MRERQRRRDREYVAKLMNLSKRHLGVLWLLLSLLLKIKSSTEACSYGFEEKISYKCIVKYIHLMLHWIWSNNLTYVFSEHSPIEWKPCLRLDTRCPSKVRVACYRHIWRLLELHIKKGNFRPSLQKRTILPDVMISKKQIHLLK